MKISIVFPVYIPSHEHKRMTDRNLYLAKSLNKLDVEWVIVETGSQYYIDEADVYVYESERSNITIGVNRGFYCATGDYVIFLANDVTVCEDWVQKMLDCFEKFPDCGIGSLGNNEHKDVKKDEIIESLYFSVCALKKEDAWVDPWYTHVFNDTDLVFRLHLKGKKFYKNLNGIVNHLPHATLGEYSKNKDDYYNSINYFKEKYKDYKDDPLYRRSIGE